ncbi:hypothetical protein [Streptomyces sp. NPDC059649]|uniref:hypothetical protein n=1 Tax=Streptomyces sp. NPDC059649 TaxID=3346895 RepID=UPI003683282D
MARIRSIKPEFFTSLTVADLTPEQRLTFIGLWTHADDEGRCVDDARLIKAAVWPLDDRTAADIEGDLGALSESSLILRYTLNRKRYLAVRSWSEHQRINRPTASKLPPPPEGPEHDLTCPNDSSSTPHGDLTEDSLAERKGKEQGKEQGKEGAEPPASADAPPRHDVERVCKHFADVIEKGGDKRPRVTDKWRTDMRRLIDIDGVTPDQAIAAIDWAHASDFWNAIILSPAKLREKYPTLRRQATSGQRKQQPAGPQTAPRHLTEEEKKRALQF